MRARSRPGVPPVRGARTVAAVPSVASSVVESVVDRLRTDVGERPLHREGQPGASGWIVLDYFDLVVHVFTPELRARYDLERLWGDAPINVVSDEHPDSPILRGEA